MSVSSRVCQRRRISNTKPRVPRRQTASVGPGRRANRLGQCGSAGTQQAWTCVFNMPPGVAGVSTGGPGAPWAVLGRTGPPGGGRGSANRGDCSGHAPLLFGSGVSRCTFAQIPPGGARVPQEQVFYTWGTRASEFLTGGGHAPSRGLQFWRQSCRANRCPSLHRQSSTPGLLTFMTSRPLI